MYPTGLDAEYGLSSWCRRRGKAVPKVAFFLCASDTLGIKQACRLISNHAPSVELVEGNVTETFERIMKNTASSRKPMTLSPAEAEANDLTPDQAAAFNSFSRPLQDAFMSGDMETMDNVISAMPKAEQDKVMKAMRSTGLLRTLEDEEIAAHERGEKLEGVMVGALNGVSLKDT